MGTRTEEEETADAEESGMNKAWERIDGTTERIKVHNGWLVHRVYDIIAWRGEGGAAHETVIGASTDMVFVEDPEHQWELLEVGKRVAA